MADHFGLKWDPKNLEIRTMSVEKTLEPLVLQVTTLVNTKGPSKKKKGKSKRANALVSTVEKATENFIQKGEQIAYENKDITQEMLSAVDEVRKTGNAMSIAAREFSEDPCSSLKRGNMVRAARNLLSAVTRLLILADMVDVHLLLKSLRVVEDDLEKLKNASSQGELLENIKAFGHNANELMNQAAKRQQELKDPQETETQLMEQQCSTEHQLRNINETVVSPDDSEDEWPPFRKTGIFDPYSDDARLAVKRISLCPLSGTLVVAGTAGHVVTAKFDTEVLDSDINVTVMNIVNDRDGFVWKGHDRLSPKQASATGQMIQHPTVIVPNKRQKSKRPSRSGHNGPMGPTSPEVEGANTGGSIRRKPSVKKPNNKKAQNSIQHQEVTQSVDSITSTLSPVESPITNLPSPYDPTSMYSNMGMATSLEGIINKQPPSYDDVIKNTQQTLHNLVNLDNYGATFNLASFQDQLILQRQVQPNTLSPPYSNQSPPHSVQSNLSMSPQAYGGSPSPAKTRPSLPTSPTHIAAMRAATQQKHGGIPQAQNLLGFDFSQAGIELPIAYSSGQQNIPSSLQPQQYQQNYYLTPPSQHSDVTPQHIIENFPTPSPESPGHWSSSSPNSCTSDWSENMTSPSTYTSTGHQTNKGSEAIYI